MPKSPVTKLLERRGLKHEDLSAEEKATMEQWRKTLSGGSITAKDVAVFCRIQLANIERQFKDLDATPTKQNRLVLLHSVYTSLMGLINNPQAEKEALEKYLDTLV